MTTTLGQPVDDFSAQATRGKTVSLSDYRGTNLVLFFYPKDNTPGCTSEAQAFAQHHSAFQQANTVVLGVSRDSLKSHEGFREKHSLPFDLISDPDEQLCTAFDVIRQKKMMGKEFLGIERSTFLIDKEGVLQHAWRKVKIKDHVEDVLQATQALESQPAAEKKDEKRDEKKEESSCAAC